MAAPWVVFENDYYYLFYTGCYYNNKCSAIGVARSREFLGLYEKHSQPILATTPNETNKSWEGPGHCSVLKKINGNYAIVYHAWPHGGIGTVRLMMTDHLRWVDDWPTVHNGSPS